MSYYGSGSGAGGYYGQQQHGGHNERQNYAGGKQYGYGDGSSWQQQPSQPVNQSQFQQGFMQQQLQPQQQQQQHQHQQQNQFNNDLGVMRQQPSSGATSSTAATGMPSFWNPATAATMAAMAASTVASGGSINNDAMLDLASTAGKSFLQNGTARMIPGLESSMLALRSYFAVDNKYVVLKMKRVLLPILSDRHGWQRQIREPGTHETPTIFELPKFDECAPDLYLPVMSLITYVLLSAMCYGTAGEFNPEVIPDVATKCAIYQTLEVAVVRGGFYTMQVPVSLLDLFSYTGYKYLGLCINMVAGIIVGHFGLFGSRGYYACFLWTATAAAYFMLKTMSNNIPLHTSPTGPKREIMILAFAGLQYFTMWMVSQTKFL